MATHFICQSTEPLPHTFPPGGAEKTHGAVSQYELYNSGNKAHTRFPPPGWDFSQTSEEDSLPLCQPVPQPSWKDYSLTPDPDLLVTPQKPQRTSSNVNPVYQKPSVNPDPLLCVTPEKTFYAINPPDDDDFGGQKGKPRVRFDIKENLNDGSFIDTSVSKNLDSQSFKKPVQTKAYQPELFGEEYDSNQSAGEEDEPSKNKAFSHGRTVKYTVGKINNQPVYIPLQNQEDFVETQEIEDKESEHLKQTVIKNRDLTTKQAGIDRKAVKVIRENIKDEKQKETIPVDPIAASRGFTENVTIPKRKVKVLRENQYGPKLNGYTFPFNQEVADYAGGDEHMFARPEYNSTLRMKKEADKLKESEIDVVRALQKKLTVSESTKTEINEKV